jgi:hypothetical protein
MRRPKAAKPATAAGGEPASKFDQLNGGVGFHATHPDRAPRPMDGETVRAYRVRLLKNFRHNSPDYKDVPIEQIAQLPPAMFDVAESRIYADSVAASACPEVTAGYLREVKRTDASGRQISTFYGEPRTWMSQFAGQTRRVANFRQPRWDGPFLGRKIDRK